MNPKLGAYHSHAFGVQPSTSLKLYSEAKMCTMRITSGARARICILRLKRQTGRCSEVRRKVDENWCYMSIKNYSERKKEDQGWNGNICPCLYIHVNTCMCV